MQRSHVKTARVRAKYHATYFPSYFDSEDAQQINNDSTIKWDIDFANGLFRVDSESWIWSTARQTFLPKAETLVFDGTTIKQHFPTRKNALWNDGRATPEYATFEATDYRCVGTLSDFPVLYIFKILYTGDPPKSADFRSVAFSPTQVKDAQQNNIVVATQGNVITYLDRTRDFAVVGQDILSEDGGLAYKLTVENQQVSGVWIPANWTIARVDSTSGTPIWSRAYRVEDVQLGITFEPDTFHLAIPVGAPVRSASGLKKFENQ